MKVHIEGDVPDGDVVETLLQLVRTFDTQHPGCHFKIGVDGSEDGPNLATERIAAMFGRIDPPFSFNAIYKSAASMLSEEELRMASHALIIAANSFYASAWRDAGPNGSNPGPEFFKTMIMMGDEYRSLARKLGSDNAC